MRACCVSLAARLRSGRLQYQVVHCRSARPNGSRLGPRHHQVCATGEAQTLVPACRVGLEGCQAGLGGAVILQRLRGIEMTKQTARRVSCPQPGKGMRGDDWWVGAPKSLRRLAPAEAS